MPNDPSTAPVSRGLSSRGEHVARMAGQGLSDAAIAYALGVTEAQVRRALGAALRTLRLRRRTDLPWLLAEHLDHTSLELDGAMLTSAEWDAAAVAKLSPALRDVATGVVEGRTDRQIARARGVSPRTVANQLRQIFARLGVRDRVELVRALVGRR